MQKDNRNILQMCLKKVFSICFLAAIWGSFCYSDKNSPEDWRINKKYLKESKSHYVLLKVGNF